MADKIFPSTNDVGPVAGDGRIATESSLADWRNSAAALLSHYRNGEQVGAGGVISGFDFSSGTATSITLTAGTAVIRGYKVEDTDTIVGTLTASTFNFVFLALTKSGGLVTGLELQVRTAATFNTALASVPDDSILIWCFETDGSSIVTQYDFRKCPSNIMTGSYIGNDAATRTIDLGFRPKMVEIYRRDSPGFVARSPLSIPQLGTLAGLVIVDGGSSNGTPFITSDPELVPILSEEGFTIEDGPGTLEGVWLRGSKTYDPPSTLDGNSWSTTVTVTGVSGVGSIATAEHENAVTAEWSVLAVVSAADEVTVTFTNGSGVTKDLASGTLTAFVFETKPVALWKLNELNKTYFFIAWY